MNRVILCGRLGRDPESRESSNGTTIANLRLATDDRRKVDGNWENVTEWHSVVCFGRTAENAARFLTKGRQVLVEGRLQTSSWENKAGEKKYKTEVIADRIEFVGGRNDRNETRSTASDDVPF